MPAEEAQQFVPCEVDLALCEVRPCGQLDQTEYDFVVHGGRKSILVGSSDTELSDDFGVPRLVEHGVGKLERLLPTGNCLAEGGEWELSEVQLIAIELLVFACLLGGEAHSSPPPAQPKTTTLLLLLLFLELLFFVHLAARSSKGFRHLPVSSCMKRR
jgi:hypothetical protein